MPAIERAVTLLRDPLCVAWMRKERLPHDVSLVLRVLAGDADAEQEAVRVTGKPVELIREAAAFYATQIFFHSTSDPYRLLGAHPEATRSELRSNLALLLRWLHPDIAGPKYRGAAERVIAAWNSLKEADTRLSVDADLARRREDNSRRRKATSSGKAVGRSPPNRRLSRRAPVTTKRGHAGRPPSRRKLVVILACLTGGLVVSTLVSNDPLASVQQLIAMVYQSDTPTQSTTKAQSVMSSPRAELAR